MQLLLGDVPAGASGGLGISSQLASNQERIRGDDFDLHSMTSLILSAPLSRTVRRHQGRRLCAENAAYAIGLLNGMPLVITNQRLGLQAD